MEETQKERVAKLNTASRAKVAAEVADDEFARWCDAMDLDVDPLGMDGEDKASFAQAKRRIVEQIIAGRARVDEDGQLTYDPKSGGDTLVFQEPDGAILMEMDKKKRDHDVRKMYAVAAGITKQQISRFARMKQRDLRFVSATVALFLG